MITSESIDIFLTWHTLIENYSFKGGGFMIFPMTDENNSYEGGYDCGLNGANMINCNFSFFSCIEKTKAWENGKSDGEEEKARREGEV